MSPQIHRTAGDIGLCCTAPPSASGRPIIVLAFTDNTNPPPDALVRRCCWHTRKA
jgi:hypothetical protein